MIENKYIYIFYILISLLSYPACFSHQRGMEERDTRQLNEERRKKVDLGDSRERVK